jgi:hypothetical protein
MCRWSIPFLENLFSNWFRKLAHIYLALICNISIFQMVTEDCQTNLHVRHVQFHDAESEEFYVIRQQ